MRISIRVYAYWADANYAYILVQIYLSCTVSSGIVTFLFRKVLMFRLLKRTALPFRVLAPIKNVAELPISSWSNVESNSTSSSHHPTWNFTKLTHHWPKQPKRLITLSINWKGP